MLRSMFGVIAILACSASLALADAKDDLAAAVQKVAGGGNYSWTTTVAGGFGAGSTEGKTLNGLAYVSLALRDNSYEVYIKGDKATIKTADGWKSAAEILADADNGGGGGGGGGFNPDMMAARMTQNYKAPAGQAADMLDKLQNLQVADGVYSADLTEDAAKKLLTFRRRPSADANAGPQVSNAKATIKLWIADGALSKSEIHVTGTVSFNGNDRDIDRTTTIEFKNVGSTTIDVPAEAQAKLDAPASQPAAQ
jgi:hypothetical protein